MLCITISRNSVWYAVTFLPYLQSKHISKLASNKRVLVIDSRFLYCDITNDFQLSDKVENSAQRLNWPFFLPLIINIITLIRKNVIFNLALWYWKSPKCSHPVTLDEKYYMATWFCNLKDELQVCIAGWLVAFLKNKKPNCSKCVLYENILYSIFWNWE